MIHLKDDVERYESLDSCAAWLFENYMQQLKRKVRSVANPAAQLVKRIKENLEVGIYTTLENKIRHRRPNNAFRTNTGKYCEVIRPLNDQNKFLCRVYHTPENLFSYPCSSSLIGQAKFRKLNYELKNIDSNSLTTRCIKIQEHRNNVAFLPLQHSF